MRWRQAASDAWLAATAAQGNATSVGAGGLVEGGTSTRARVLQPPCSTVLPEHMGSHLRSTLSLGVPAWHQAPWRWWWGVRMGPFLLSSRGRLLPA